MTDPLKKSIQKTCKNSNGATSLPEEGFGILPLGEPAFLPTKKFDGIVSCQPFSNAGKRAGTSDTRHLWPHFYRLIAAAKPSVVFGEQVSSKLGYDWFDGVASDLESQDYQCEAVDIPACAVNAPHKRNRLYWIARLLGNPDERIWRRGISTEWKIWNEFLAKSSETNVADAERMGCKTPQEITPESEKFRILNETLIGQNTNGEQEKTENLGALNPEFVFWLMGFPEEWINSISEEMLSSYRSRRIYQSVS